MTGSIVSDKPLDKVKLAKFWEDMTGLFGYKWSSQYGEIPNGHWLTLVNNLDDSAIEVGIKNLVATSNGWPPTPIEFNHLCSNISLKSLGLPSVDVAFSQVLSGRELREPVIIAAVKEMDSYELRMLKADDKANYKRIKDEFEYYYFAKARLWAENKRLDEKTPKAIESENKRDTARKQQENVGHRSTDVLIDEAIRLQGLDKENGRKAFLEAKRNLRGRA